MTSKALNISDISVGSNTHEIEIPITLQRLVMEAGANRDLSLIHHDKQVAITTGAKDAYANSFFLMGMFERLLREWMGPSGRICKLGPMKMTAFNCVGDCMRFSGTVTDCKPDSGKIELDLSALTENGQTVSCLAVVELS